MLSWIYPTLFAPCDSPAVFCLGWTFYSLILPFLILFGSDAQIHVHFHHLPPVPTEARDRRVADISQVHRGTLVWPIAILLPPYRYLFDSVFDHPMVCMVGGLTQLYYNWSVRPNHECEDGREIKQLHYTYYTEGKQSSDSQGNKKQINVFS